MGQMIAKFAGSCSVCRGNIKVGSTIEYVKGSGAMHVMCATPSRQATFGAPRPAGASAKQVAFALRLLGERGYSTRYMDSAFKRLGASMRERSGTVESWLQAKSSAEVSALIDQLQAEGRAAAPAREPEETETTRRAGYPTEPPTPDAREISGKREGRHDSRYVEGQVVVYDAKSASGAKYGVVLASKMWPPHEDNQRFGWSESAWVRPATEDEAAPLRERKALEAMAPRVARYLCALVRAGERLPESEAAIDRCAPVGARRWAWTAPTTQTTSGAVVEADPSLGLQTVAIIEDGGAGYVVGHHGGHFDDYRPSAWRVPMDERIAQLLGALTGGGEGMLRAASDAAIEAGYP